MVVLLCFGLTVRSNSSTVRAPHGSTVGGLGEQGGSFVEFLSHDQLALAPGLGHLYLIATPLSSVP